MSRIFDALQRSAAERPDAQPAGPDATELLQHVEQRAAAAWDVPAPERNGARNGKDHAAASNGAPLPANGAHREAAVEPRRPEARPEARPETRQEARPEAHPEARPEARSEARESRSEVRREARGGSRSETRSEARTEAQAGPAPEIFNQFQTLTIVAPAHGRLVSVSDKDSPAAEAFRLLAVRLRHMRRDRQLKKLLVTSSIPQEGKSTCSSNLACSLALRAHQRVLLLEGDVRRPSLSPMFGLVNRPGVCEWLRQERELKDCVYYLDGADLWFMPAGNSPSNPLEILQSGRVPMLLDRLVELFDWVIIDSPPVLPLADTSVWSRLADGILIVTRQGTSEKRQLQRAIDSIESQKLIGALLNSSNSAPHTDYYYSPRPAGKSGRD